MSINRAMHKQTVIHPYNETPFNNAKDALIHTVTWIKLLNSMQSERGLADHMLCDSRIREI